MLLYVYPHAREAPIEYLRDVVMAKGQGHGFFCFCKKCTGQSKSTPKPTQLGGGASYPKRDTGGVPAKRQTQKNHGTNRRGGGPR